MSIKLISNFAILDVQGSGRHKLAERMPPGSRRLPKEERIPVVITGFIDHQHGSDDGISIEFGVDVTEAEIWLPRPDITRVEVVDRNGRVFTSEGGTFKAQLQDKGRTLKLTAAPGDPVKRKKGQSLPRTGRLKARSRIKNPIAGTWTKRDDTSGKFVETRVNPEPFRGVRKKK